MRLWLRTPWPSPGSGSLDAVEAGSCPPVLTFQRRDPSLDTGPPPDQLTEVFFLLPCFACLAGFAGAGYRNDTDAEISQFLVDCGLPVATRHDNPLSLRSDRWPLLLIERGCTRTGPGDQTSATPGSAADSPIHDDLRATGIPEFVSCPDSRVVTVDVPAQLLRHGGGLMG